MISPAPGFAHSVQSVFRFWQRSLVIASNAVLQYNRPVELTTKEEQQFPDVSPLYSSLLSGISKCQASYIWLEFRLMHWLQKSQHHACIIALWSTSVLIWPNGQDHNYDYIKFPGFTSCLLFMSSFLKHVCTSVCSQMAKWWTPSGDQCLH